MCSSDWQHYTTIWSLSFREKYECFSLYFCVYIKYVLEKGLEETSCSIGVVKFFFFLVTGKSENSFKRGERCSFFSKHLCVVHLVIYDSNDL